MNIATLGREKNKTKPQKSALVEVWFVLVLHKCGKRVKVDIFTFGKPKPCILAHVMCPY